MTMALHDWRLRGLCLELSNGRPDGGPCALAWPAPTAPCRALLVWQIGEGHLEEVPLGGLRAALALEAPAGRGWRAAAYLDRRASEAQRQALMWTLGGQDGGLPEHLAARISHFLGVRTMTIERDGPKELILPGLARARIAAMPEAVLPAGRSPVAPAASITVHSLLSLNYADFGMDWRIVGGKAFHAEFDYGGI